MTKGNSNFTEGKRTADFGSMGMAHANMRRVASSIQDLLLRDRALSIVDAISKLDDDLRKHRGIKPRNGEDV